MIRIEEKMRSFVFIMIPIPRSIPTSPRIMDSFVMGIVRGFGL